MKRPITWAELILFTILMFGGIAGLHQLYGFVTNKISIEVHVKK